MVFNKIWIQERLCSQMLDFTLIFDSQKYCVHQFLLYKEVSANGLVLDFERVAIKTLNLIFFIFKDCHEKVKHGYTLTFCVTKLVHDKVKIIIY